jgi:hypothetical protein
MRISRAGGREGDEGNDGEDRRRRIDKEQFLFTAVNTAQTFLTSVNPFDRT